MKLRLTDITEHTPLYRLGELCHRNARNKGFYDDIKEIELAWTNGVLDEDEAQNIITRLEAVRFGLIGTEVSEAMEAHRKGDFANEGEELADAIIRIVEYAFYRGFDLDAELESKVQKNHDRPHMHGGKAY